MARTAASARTIAATRSNSAARSSLSNYRLPIDLLNMGVTYYWDFRTGFANADNATVINVVDGGDMIYSGTTALSSVYTTGSYQADLEASSSDYFKTNSRVLVNGTTAFTAFAWVKLESTSTVRAMMSQWETVANRRGFQLRLTATGVMQLSLSSAGTAGTVANYDTTDTLTDTAAWHFIVATYDTTNRGQISLDNVARTTTLATGTDPASIFSGNASIMLGSSIPSAPTTFWDGLVGICGIAPTTSMSTSQISTLYRITNSIGKYV